MEHFDNFLYIPTSSILSSTYSKSTLPTSFELKYSCQVTLQMAMHSGQFSVFIIVMFKCHLTWSLSYFKMILFFLPCFLLLIFLLLHWPLLVVFWTHHLFLTSECQSTLKTESSYPTSSSSVTMNPVVLAKTSSPSWFYHFSEPLLHQILAALLLNCNLNLTISHQPAVTTPGKATIISCLSYSNNCYPCFYSFPVVSSLHNNQQDGFTK